MSWLLSRQVASFNGLPSEKLSVLLAERVGALSWCSRISLKPILHRFFWILSKTPSGQTVVYRCAVTVLWVFRVTVALFTGCIERCRNFLCDTSWL